MEKGTAHYWGCCMNERKTLERNRVRMNIYLLAEGEVRDRLISHLVAWGHSVIFGTDVKKADQTIQGNIPAWHAVIADEKILDHASSLSLAIRNHPQGPKIVMMARDGGQSNVARLSTGGHTVLTLPFHNDELMAALA